MGFDIGRRFKVICRLSLLPASLVIGTPPASAADTRAPMGDDYLAALNAIQTSKERQSLQHLFELAIKEAPGIQAELPNLSEADYAALKARLSGFILNRDKAAYVRPSADFQGTGKNRNQNRSRFFEVYVLTEPARTQFFPPTSVSRPITLRARSSAALHRQALSQMAGLRTTYPASMRPAQGELDSMDAGYGGNLRLRKQGSGNGGPNRVRNCLSGSADCPETPRPYRSYQGRHFTHPLRVPFRVALFLVSAPCGHPDPLPSF